MSLQQLNQYSQFTDELKALYERFPLDFSNDASNELLSVDQALDGAASDRLKELIAPDVLKQQSAFFTGRELSNWLLSDIEGEIVSENGAVVFDPACGAGDLLIAAARHLPIFETLDETLWHWSQRLKGYDQSQSFIEATKYRLALLALHRQSISPDPLPNPLNYFDEIRKVDDSLSDLDWPECDYVLLNPPFSKVQAPEDLDWASGTVSQAGLFLMRSLDILSSGQGILAILPDVLRSGSRYRRWREGVESAAIIKKMKTIGKFDSSTDIDVFGVHLTSSTDESVSEQWWPRGDEDLKRVGNLFNLKVGPVVPHRNSESEATIPFFDTSSLPPWETIDSSDAPVRGYERSTVTPPFVTVRRTSSPSDPKRAVGTIVTGKHQVAVENHLIVLTPKEGGLEKCKELLRRLEDDRTDDWLNTRIRCRHLTISSLEKLPWWEL